MLSELAQHVWSACRMYDLIRQRDRVLLAVSGGPDSMAMLELMQELSRPYQLTLHVAHIDHGLRGRESDRDRSFVQRYAGFVDLPVSVSRTDVAGRRRTRGGSLEEVARIERYAALERIRKKHGLRVILTAHHADDQIETVLMRIMRGTDVKGLAGILPYRSHPPVVRPLLQVRQQELMSYLRERRIPYREDSTNADIRHTRNRIRHRTIPDLLRHGQQDLLADVPRLADAARRLSRHLFEIVPMYLGGQTDVRHGRTLVHLNALHMLSEGVRRSYIGMLLSGMGVQLSTERIERTNRLMHQSPGKRIRFRSAQAEVLRDRHHLVFGPVRSVRSSAVRLKPGGMAQIEGSKIRAGRPGRRPRAFPGSRTEIWVDADSLKRGLTVRLWRSGDRLQPLGMGGKSKKVSDILRDAHVPLYYKETIPVVVSGNRIVWVCGIRQDERFKLTPDSVSAVKLSYHPHV